MCFCGILFPQIPASFLFQWYISFKKLDDSSTSAIWKCHLIFNRFVIMGTASWNLQTHKTSGGLSKWKPLGFSDLWMWPAKSVARWLSFGRLALSHICSTTILLLLAFKCKLYFLAATKQLYEWFSLSVCLSVRPSHLFDYLPIIISSWNFQYNQWQKRRPCIRSRSEVKGQGHRGQHQTYRFPDRNSSLNSHMMMKWCT